MRVTKVVVVGAGIAGLGAAYSMHKAGVEVTVLEATPHVGGRMRSREWNGAWIDLGAEFIATPGFDEMLFHELGIMKDRLTYPGGEVSFNMWRDGEAHRFSYTDASGVLRFGGLTWWEKARLAGMLPAYVRMWRELGGRVEEPWRGAWADDESVGEWLARVAPSVPRVRRRADVRAVLRLGAREPFEGRVPRHRRSCPASRRSGPSARVSAWCPRHSRRASTCTRARP